MSFLEPFIFVLKLIVINFIIVTFAVIVVGNLVIINYLYYLVPTIYSLLVASRDMQNGW